MKRKRCYISGRITGLPWGEVERNFSSAVLQVFKLGYAPVSPLNNGVPRWMPWIVHMAVDICTLLTCDCIALQGNFKESRGAMIEYRIAQRFKKHIILMY
jgi:hypothetical protein